MLHGSPQAESDNFIGFVLSCPKGTELGTELMVYFSCFALLSSEKRIIGAFLLTLDTREPAPPSLKIMIDEVAATVEYYLLYIDRTNVDGYATSPNFGEIAVFSDRNAQVTS
ncbi:MAG: hypothetical protein D3915_07760 [Candidatus Electrothrix sp. AU1_5]|nr:hypothetical protein [Candidatus Electrothrix gigas]MCI5193012.1 hypothetical protein [Candidatus Electrothrix gigas]